MLLLDRGGLQGDSASVERQQRLPWDRPQNRLRQAQALGDPTHVDTGATAEREFLLKAVPTNDNVADLTRVEELLAKLGVRRCASGLVVASLIEANDFDARAVHVATVSLAHEVMLLIVGCVVLVLVLVALAGAGADCWWHRCCRGTATREYRVCSARRRLMQATLRDEIRVVSWRCGLSTRGVKEDLIKRLLHENGAQALTEEAAAALLLVRRRLGSKPDGFALTDDAGAIRWIVKVCREKSVHDNGCEAISGWRRRRARRSVTATVRGTAGCEPRFEAGVAQ